MNYFAYGSNLSSRYMREYCPGADFVIRADLPNFEIQFRQYSENMQGGISSIIPAPGQLVHGILLDIPEEAFIALDELEDVPLGKYLRDTFLVLGLDGAWHKAEVYRVANPSGPYTPARQYLDYMIEGAEEHGLPSTYVQDLTRRRDELA